MLVAMPVLAQPADPAAQAIATYHAAIAPAARAPTPAERARRFEPVVRAAYDFSGAARLLAGAAWTRATAAERTAAIDALVRFSAARHAANFRATDKVTAEAAAVPRGADRVVRGSIGGTALTYRLRADPAGGWRILDLSARGVSQLAVQRSDLAATVAKGGVPAMTAKLGDLTRAQLAAR